MRPKPTSGRGPSVRTNAPTATTAVESHVFAPPSGTDTKRREQRQCQARKQRRFHRRRSGSQPFQTLYGRGDRTIGGWRRRIMDHLSACSARSPASRVRADTTLMTGASARTMAKAARASWPATVRPPLRRERPYREVPSGNDDDWHGEEKEVVAVGQGRQDVGGDKASQRSQGAGPEVPVQPEQRQRHPAGVEHLQMGRSVRRGKAGMQRAALQAMPRRGGLSALVQAGTSRSRPARSSRAARRCRRARCCR